MGRRALPKIDPSLDLSRHFLSVDELCRRRGIPRRCSAAAAPLEVEVGSGKGLFLQNAALATPDRDFLGVELALRYARFTAARLAKREFANARCVHGDALKLFREWIPDASLAAVHVYFPDPVVEGAAPQAARDERAVLADVVRTLRTGRPAALLDRRARILRRHAGADRRATPLAGPLEVPERPAEHDLDFRTHFERRTRLHGEAGVSRGVRQELSDSQPRALPGAVWRCACSWQPPAQSPRLKADA